MVEIETGKPGDGNISVCIGGLSRRLLEPPFQRPRPSPPVESFHFEAGRWSFLRRASEHVPPGQGQQGPGPPGRGVGAGGAAGAGLGQDRLAF